jgi:phage/plasmid primase-like uncharacterized protein
MSFINFARAHGVEIHDLYPSATIRRCGTVDHPRSKNGAYFWDGARGFVWNWAAEATAQWFNDANAQPWSEAEKTQWRLKRAAAASQQSGGHRRATLRADEMLGIAKPGEHNYLHIKGFPDAQGLVAADGALLIPMRSLERNELQGLQMIRWISPERRYEKKMLPGMKARGAVFRLGNQSAPETFLVEGYATGLSVMAALGSVGLHACVLVCFSAGNLVHVAPQVRGKCFVFADHDESQAGENAALQTRLPYCMSPALGDANDLHVKSGLMAVCAQLMAVRRLALSP